MPLPYSEDKHPGHATISVVDSVQKLMYEAMLRVTGDDLSQILRVLGVTTTGIATMADLLNVQWTGHKITVTGLGLRPKGQAPRPAVKSGTFTGQGSWNTSFCAISNLGSLTL